MYQRLVTTNSTFLHHLLLLSSNCPSRCYGRFASRSGDSRPTDWPAKLVYKLTKGERQALKEALAAADTDHRLNSEGGDQLRSADNSIKATPSPLITPVFRLVFIANALPFIGFGILDNSIMILAGEYIDLTLASALGLSTMAAAGLGNMVSDVCGVSTTSYVEQFASRLGYAVPPVPFSSGGGDGGGGGQDASTKRTSRSTRWATFLGRVCGIAFGGFIGLWPLLLFDNKPSHSSSSTASDDHDNSSDNNSPS